MEEFSCLFALVLVGIHVAWFLKSNCRILSAFVVIVGFCYCGNCVTYLFAVRNYVFVVLFWFFTGVVGTPTLWSSPSLSTRQPLLKVHQSGWVIGSSPAPKKSPNYYTSLKEHYEKIISENEILSVPSLLQSVNTKTISLLTIDVKSRKLIGVNREIMKATLKSLNIATKYIVTQCGTYCSQRKK